MLPYKYRTRKVDEICFRNVSTKNQIYYLEMFKHDPVNPGEVVYRLESPPLDNTCLVREKPPPFTLICRILSLNRLAINLLLISPPPFLTLINLSAFSRWGRRRIPISGNFLSSTSKLWATWGRTSQRSRRLISRLLRWECQMVVLKPRSPTLRVTIYGWIFRNKML